MWEMVIAALLVVVALLLYRIYRMKSVYDNTVRMGTLATDMSISRKIAGIENDSLLDTEVNEKMHGMEDKLSEMGKRVERNDELVKRLVKELGR